MMLAFIASGALGMLVEWALIRHLYKRPLDTLLATWGLSLILQQAYRSVFGAREVGVELPRLDDGLAAGHRHDRDPDQRHVRDGADHPDHHRASPTCCSGRAGASRCAPWCRTASWRAPSASTPRRSTATPSASAAASPASPARLHHDRLDRADRRPALHRRHLPGRRVRRRRRACSAPSLRPSRSRRRSRRWNSSCRARWPRCITLLAIVGILMMRPQGLFALKVRK